MIKALSSLLYRRANVNCWFCSQDQDVDSRQVDWWKCKFCDQYNGFAEDGDYRYPVPGMHKDGDEMNCAAVPDDLALLLARTRLKQLVHYSDSFDAYENCPFCAECSNNLSLKVRQIAKFLPVNPDNYESEFRDFRARLEQQYALCAQCEKRVDAEIARKNALLQKDLAQSGGHAQAAVRSFKTDSFVAMRQPMTTMRTINMRALRNIDQRLLNHQRSGERFTSVSDRVTCALLALRILSNIYVILDRLAQVFSENERWAGVLFWKKAEQREETTPSQTYGLSPLFLSALAVMTATDFALQWLRPILFNDKSFACVLLANVVLSLFGPVSAKLKNLLHIISAVTLLNLPLTVIASVRRR